MLSDWRSSPRLFILLDRSKPHMYRAGECVSGSLRVDSEQVFSVKVIHVEILGRTVVAAPCEKIFRPPKWWTRERKLMHPQLFALQGAGCVVTDLPRAFTGSPSRDKPDLQALEFPSERVLTKLVPEFRTVNEEIHCSGTVNVLGNTCPGSCEMIPPGEHCYTFQFNLSKSCPCSFSGARGSVEYRILATVQHTNGFRQHAVQGFKVIRELVLDRYGDVPSTFACPPISRNFISSFDLFASNEDLTPLVNLVKQRVGTDLLSGVGNDTQDAHWDLRPRSPSLWTVEPQRKASDSYEWQLAVEKQRRGDLCCTRWRDTNRSHVFVKARRFSKPNGTSEKRDIIQPLVNVEQIKHSLKPVTFKHKIRHWITRSLSSSPSNHAENKTTVRLSRCADNEYLLPSTWISRSYTSSYGSYPSASLGAQTGYAVSCRLTVSQRQLVPGESVTARLTLFVEDPFALILSPTADTVTPDNFHWCAMFKGPCSRQAKRLWSPLARAFVSYFLEDSFRKRLNGVERYTSRVWWKGVVSQPYRIFLVLRQLICYRDWTGHVIAEEERDIYVAEMENKNSTEGHLLRVVLEHVFCVPPVTPSGLEGCAGIDVSYRVGVINFKLKRKRHLWAPNEWQVLKEKKPASMKRDIERLYTVHSYGIGTQQLRWNRSSVTEVQHQKRGIPPQGWDIYRDLQLSIPFTIGTAKSMTFADPLQSGPHIANGILGPAFFMQWPDSCEKGSLPPVNVCYYADASLRSSRSTIMGHVEKPSQPISRRRSSAGSGGGCRVTTDAANLRGTSSITGAQYTTTTPDRRKTLCNPLIENGSNDISRRSTILHRSIAYRRQPARHSVPQTYTDCIRTGTDDMPGRRVREPVDI